jgi:hypothetical protein
MVHPTRRGRLASRGLRRRSAGLWPVLPDVLLALVGWPLSQAASLLYGTLAPLRRGFFVPPVSDNRHSNGSDPRFVRGCRRHPFLSMAAVGPAVGKSWPYQRHSRDAADRKARAIVDDLRAARMNTAADLVERSVSETLTYYAFPDIHWQKIRTNNPLERIRARHHRMEPAN